MVYDWDGKRDICYQMYIKEKKALEEIMDYMKNTYQFAPSKRAFQTQFKRWGFPSKQNPAHKNTELVARVKQLWECNTSQRDMLKILNEEGFEIKERELMRVRAKNRWLLRVPNGMKTQANFQPPQHQSQDEGLLALQEEVYKSPGLVDDHLNDHSNSTNLPSQSLNLSPEVLAKRKERFERLKAESAERWATRKRRRRTRGWAGLPADPPGPPRFPSETTIDESKRYLSLDIAMYREIRDQFQAICEQSGFIKKTVAGPERWQAAKDKLIQASPHLQQIFCVDPNQLDAKALALDVVCTDVTKRMRTLERRMTIAEAKNTLGINPEESRQIRNIFYNMLKADHFTSKLEAGDDHWRELKEKWIQESGLLQQILSSGPTGSAEHAQPTQASKLKALEVLCRDVMKRLRDDQTKRDPSRKRPRASSTIRRPVTNDNTACHPFPGGISNGISTLASQALASAPMPTNDLAEIQIDPSLLQAANDPSFATRDQHDTGQAFGYVDPLLETSLPDIPIYLRISPHSQLHCSSKTWVEKLITRSISELRQHVVARYPDSEVTRIEGLDKDEHGNEISFLIDEDHELDAYLTHVQARKASFFFCLSEI
ncbi:hypothetical protein ASPZODRAFT_129979 [Penicilliopsis zonata CBS 506.65]|uniref:Uncharacterized protein n=1 Tax=Penicilliopsis zonata CBS 506.65 TaxID=1073090 RepID=A0A1L9SLJ4_9EURO|nr:hypothetical protein ASPZODRAFT_129979 [Penicilliopsis zonata CBS 506.65]OJJ48058.1 hypothetical protein ASPZODRAFT_129979 [Penicilliopsis zonata CBS 506.65]